MTRSSWSNWLKSFFRRPAAKTRQRRPRRPRVEALELRLAPATFIWDGGGGDNRWSTGPNWLGDVAPNPAGGDDLVFPVLSGPTPRYVNRNDFASATFNSLSFSGSTYSITGNQLTLGSALASSGFLIANLGATSNELSFNILMGGAAGNQQFFTVGALGATMKLSGRLIGTSGVELTKTGPGVLILNNDNSGFTGPISIEAGILRMSDANALGSTSTPTAVLTNAQLQLENVAGPILENLILNGPGVSNDGALLNLAGNSTWAGEIRLDSNASIGVFGNASVATSLNVTGQVTDLGSGHNLTKQGAGRLIFSRDNTYRGLTTINNGILTIRHPQALGAQGSLASGTVVNSSVTGSATLQLEAITGPGFTVVDERLTLNGPGFGGQGALHNLAGNNSWGTKTTLPDGVTTTSTGAVTLGSPPPFGVNVQIGVAATTNLTINGVVDDVNGIFTLTKLLPGRLTFTNANTYRGFTTIAQGVINIRDSQGLGAPGSSSTTVLNGASLELQVDASPDSLLVGDTNRLNVGEVLTINGRGFIAAGALRSISGINEYSARITLAGTVAAIGVEPDPVTEPNINYFTNDWSLTVTQPITGTAPAFAKVGRGHLILPIDNPYLARTTIEQGWVTVRTNQALGGRIQGIGDTVQPGTTVIAGAALHLWPFPGILGSPGDLNLAENLTLTGIGISHNFSLISNKGALMSLGGNNVAGTLNAAANDRRTSNIGFIGQVGIGVEALDAALPSELTLTASTYETVPVAFIVSGQASGFELEDSNVIDTGSTQGTITIRYDFYAIPDTLRVFYPPRGQPGSTRIFDTGQVSGSATVLVPYGPGASTLVEIVLNEGGTDPGTVWDYTATIQPIAVTGMGGIIKFGSKRLTVQGDGTYRGDVDIREGIVRAQNDTALGAAAGSTIVRSGTALELSAGVAELNGGISAGIQVGRGERLVLEDNTSDPIIPLQVLDNDHLWRGPVTLVNHTVLSVPANTRLSFLGDIDDAFNPSPSGSGLIKIGAGKLALGGNNTYRGLTNIVEGIVNLQSAQALGLPSSGTVVAAGAGLELQGDITIAGEALTIQGSGTNVAASIPARWFAQGPGPVVDANGQASSGRISGIVVDPSDPNVIYVTAAGGGGWRTKNSGQLGVTWEPLADTLGVLFTGAIAIAPSDPRILYLGTGEATNAQLSFYGKGVYKSLDSGKNWTLLLHTDGTNPLEGLAVSRIAIDPMNPDRIYVATSDLAANNTFGNRVGVYSYDPNFLSPTPGWFNMTSVVSTARQILAGQAGAPPRTPGPDDDFRLVFPQSNAAWTDVSLVYVTTPTSSVPVPVVYASLGVPSRSLGTPIAGGGVNSSSAVYRTENPTSQLPAWYVGDPGMLRNQVQQLTIMNPSIPGMPTLANGSIELRFNGASTPVPPDPATLLSNATAAQIQAALMALRTIGGLGGTVTVAMVSSSVTQNVFSITFGGTLGMSPQPLVTGVPYGGTPPVAISGNITTPGGGIDTRSAGAFPTGAGRNGRIRFTLHVPPGTPSIGSVTLYAAIENPVGGLREIQRSVNGGRVWAASGATSNIAVNQGWHDLVIQVDPNNPNIVAAGGQTMLVYSTNGGTAWANIANPATAIGGIVPHGDYHALAFDSSGRLVVGTGGGLWRLDDPTPAATRWTNINGNLEITQFIGLDVHPTDRNVAYGGTRNNGTLKYTGDPAWTQVRIEDGGFTRVDPRDPSIVYHQFTTSPLVLQSSTLERSDSAGIDPDGAGPLMAWNPINSFGPPNLYAPYALDNVNSSRLLVGAGAVMESFDRGATWIYLRFSGGISAIAVAAQQGEVAHVEATGQLTDPDFGHLFDKGANTYDPDTIYVAVGDEVWVTKDHGRTWVDRSSSLFAGRFLVDIIVDPRNRDTAYVVTDMVGGGKVFSSDDAGLSWRDITGIGTDRLPDLPTYKIVLDPRNGHLYVGNDNGVYQSTDGGVSWARFGAGLPNVQVRDLVLSQTLNTLSAGTHGRSMVTIWLDAPKANAGSLRSVSGSSIWTGNITLTGDTVISADGSQALQDTPSTAQLTLIGSIGGNFNLTKIGGGDVILAGANTYTGLTEVREGVLVVRNRDALGGRTNGTIVRPGTTLEVQSDLDLEPLELFGDGISFNGHNQGAIRNVSNANTYSGPITLRTNSTIGVDSGSSLTITGVIDDGTGAFVLTKELTGTLVLRAANTYEGNTFVNQGILNVQHARALGAPSAGTVVRDGAQLQLQAPAGQSRLVVAGETLALSGSGIFNSGALVNVAGINTWEGPVLFTSIPGFSPPTVPPPAVTIGVPNGNAPLLIDGVVAEGAGTFGLTKVGAGKLVLTRANNYGGVTSILAGVLNIQNGGALGAGGGPVAVNGTVVSAGAALELEGYPSLSVAAEALALSGFGVGGGGALRSVFGNNTWSGSVELRATAALGADLPSRLTIGGVISGPAAAALHKVGASTVVLMAANNYTGPTLVNAGYLQVDGSTGNVVVNGGTLTGAGSVGTITPGANGGAHSPGSNVGILTSNGNSTWNSLKTFFVELQTTTPGTGHDQLRVTGSVNLGGARLTGSVGPGTTIGDRFTILTATGGVTGTFVQGNTAFLDGRKFSVIYNPTSVVLVRERLTSSTALTSSANPSVFGQPVSFTAAVTTEAGPVPGGTTVTFTLDGVNTTLPVSAGQAVLTPPTLSVGPHTVSARFNGDVEFGASSAGPITQTVNRAGTTTTLTSSVNPAAAGQVFELAATVAPVSPGQGNLTGAVTFFLDGTPLAPVSLSAGRAVLPVRLGAAVFRVTATYSGDGNFNSSTSGAVTQTVARAATTTTVTTTNPTTIFGGTVISARVQPVAPGAGTPTGTVNFAINSGSAITNVPISLIGGVATLALHLDAGSYSITATYAGDGNYHTSISSSISQLILQVATTTALATTNPLSVFGEAVITATVSPATFGGASATGSVVFAISNGPTTTNVTVPLLGGVATLPALNPGTYSIVALYSGNVNFAGSTSNTISQTVQRSLTTTTLMTTNPSAVFGEAVIGVTVTAASPGLGTPTGAVLFTIDSAAGPTQVTVNLAGGTATLPAPLSPGNYTINAAYDGDVNFTSSAANPIGQNIVKADATVSLSASTSPSFFGQAVGFTATIGAGAPGRGTPTGTVTFLVDGVAQATNVPLVNGRAAFGINSLSVGNHAITASYSGDDNFNSGSGIGSPTVFAQTVALSPLVITEIPAAVGSGNGFGVRVEIRDAGGNRVTSYNGPVTVAVNSGPAGGRLGGVQTVNAVGGVATFVGLTLDRAGDYTLRVAAPGVSQEVSRVSSAVRVSASRLNFVVSPTRIRTRRNFTLSVTAADVLGGADPNLTAPATVSLVRGPRGGRVSGTLSRLMSQGVVQFADLQVNKAGTYVLQVNAGGLVTTFQLTTAGRRA